MGDRKESFASVSSTPSFCHSSDQDSGPSDFEAPISGNDDEDNVFEVIANTVGPPPTYSLSDGDDGCQRSQNMSEEEEERDEHYDPYEEYDDAVPEYARNGPIDNDQEQLHCEEYTNESVQKKLQSLLNSVLLSDGIKVKAGYTAEEISTTTEKMISLSLDQITEYLLGHEKFVTLRNKSKVEWAHELVSAGWLIFKNGKFFPIVGKEQEELVKQILRGAEAEERKTEQLKKVSNEYDSEETEIRAMMTYNMFFHLISRLCDEIRNSKVSYQKISDAYNAIIEGSDYGDIAKSFGALKLRDHPKLDPEWFRHYTGRSGLKKFVGMSRFSGIQSSFEDNIPYFGIRDGEGPLSKEEFEKVHDKWSKPQERRSNDRNRMHSREDSYNRQPRQKKVEEANPDYKLKNLQLQDDDYDFNTNRRSRSRSRSSSPPRFKPQKFTGDDGFGGRSSAKPNQEEKKEEEERSSPKHSNVSRPVTSNDYQELDDPFCTESEMSEGEYSDDDEETKEKRKKKMAEKTARMEQRKREHERRQEEAKNDPQPKPVAKMKSAFDSPPKRKPSTSDEQSGEDDRNTTRRARKTFPTTSALPVTALDGSLNIQAKSARPQVPHEPSTSQLKKNREEETAHVQARLNRKEKEQEDRERHEREERERLEYEKKKNKQLSDKERILREEQRQKKKEERKRQEEEDALIARRLDEQFSGATEKQYEKEPWDGNDHEMRSYHPPQTGEFGPSRNNSRRSPLDSPSMYNRSQRASPFDVPPGPSSSQRYLNEQRDPYRDQTYYSQSHNDASHFQPPPFHHAPPRNVHRPQPHYHPQHKDQYYDNPQRFAPNITYANNYSRPATSNDFYANPSTTMRDEPTPSLGNFSIRRQQAMAEMNRQPTGNNADIEQLRQRILTFIKNQVEDGQLVTDSLFEIKYPNRLPSGFILYDFVSSNLSNEIRTLNTHDEHAYIPF